MHKLDKLCQHGNIINFEYSENFPNSGFTSLIFPIGKALGPLPKIAKKIPGFHIQNYSVFLNVETIMFPHFRLFIGMFPHCFHIPESTE